MIYSGVIKKLQNLRYMEKFWVVFARASLLVGTYANLRILTEALDPSVYGELALWISLGTITDVIITGSLNSGYERFFAIATNEDNIKSYLNSVQKLLAFSAVVIVMQCVVSMTIMKSLLTIDSINIAICALLFILITSYVTSFNTILNSARLREAVAASTVIQMLSKVAVTLLIVVFTDGDIVLLLAGYVLSGVTTLAFQLIIYEKKIHRPAKVNLPNKTRNYFKDILRYGSPFMIWGAFAAVQQVSDRWSLKYFLDGEVVGQYAVVFQLGYIPMITLSSVIAAYAAPIIFQMSGTGNSNDNMKDADRLNGKVAFLCLIATLVASCAAFLFHEYIFEYAVGSEYQTASKFLPLATLAGGFFSVSQALTLRAMSQLRPWDLLPVNICVPILATFGNIWGAMKFGIKGVFINLVIHSILLTASIFITVYRKK